MARNGSGVYELATDPFTPGTVISSTQMNMALSDIALAISESLPANGERGMYGPFMLADGTNTAPSFSFNSEASLGLYRPGSGVLGFALASAEQMRLTSNGLMIGSDVDTGERLQVNGHSKMTGNLEVQGTSIQHGDIDARGNIGADGLILSLTDLAANGNCLVGGNLWGSRALVAAGTAAAPSFGLQSQITGMYFPTSSSIALITGASETAKFETDLTTVQSRLQVKGTAAANAGLTIGSNRPDDSAAYLDLAASTGATYSSRLIRQSGSNGILQLTQTGTGRIQIESAASETRFQTSSNTTSINHIAATTVADNGVYSQSLTAAGTYQLLLKNATLTTSLTPYQITRNATGGAAAQIWRVGGDINTAVGQVETFRITDNNRFLIGNSADTIYSTDSTDVSSSYYFHGAKLGGTATISMGSESSFNANLAFGRNNTNSKRVIYCQVVGTMGSSTAGAESGSLSLQTKDTTDSAAVSRMTISATGAISTTGKLQLGHTSSIIYDGATDTSTNYNLHVFKTGSTVPSISLGTDGSDVSMLSFARVNSSSNRVIGSQIVGFSNSSTAGAEKGSLLLKTKAAADGSVQTRVTVSEVGVVSTVDVTAPNLSYKTKTVSTSAITQDGIFSTAAGFTVNTSDLATGKIFKVYNNSAASITITQGSGVTMRLVGTATTGSRTIPQRGLATFTCISGTEVVCEGAT
jgi:hypothetical protein